jgi:hypothetical protein
MLPKHAHKEFDVWFMLKLALQIIKSEFSLQYHSNHILSRVTNS